MSLAAVSKALAAGGHPLGELAAQSTITIAMISDTRPDAERVQIDLVRQLSGAQKISQSLSLSSLAIGLSRRAIARANPDLSQHEVDMLWVEYTYGKDLAERLREYLKEAVFMQPPTH